MEIRPQPGPQETYMSTPADVAFYGGAAGGGKSWALLVEPLRHLARVRGFGCVTFRRTTPQIRNEGGLWDTSQTLYAPLGATPREGYLDWTFPPHDNGVKFAHMERERDRYSWDGSQIALLQFDQLEQFSRRQFMYMFSRNRSTCGVRPYIRGNYNPVPPDDPVGGWIHEFVGWYLDAGGEYPDPAKAGIIRWFVNEADTLHWYADRETAVSHHPGIAPKSFTFIPASVFDNRILLEKDPGYLANLQALPHIDQQRLLYANHKIRAEAGKVFNRDWFPVVEAPPDTIVATARFWDFAATARKIEKGAATASVKFGRTAAGGFIVLDVTEEWLGPADIDNHVVAVARQDGQRTAVRWEEEGGSAGKRTSYELVKKLAGFDAYGVRPTGDKLERSKPLAAQARAGNVRVLRAAWTDRFLAHMHAIPDGARWDIHDAAAGSFNELATPPQPLPLKQPTQRSKWRV